MSDEAARTYVRERDERIGKAFAHLYVVMIADHPELAGPCNSEPESSWRSCGAPADVYIETKGYFSVEMRACEKHIARGLCQASGYVEARMDPRRIEFEPGP